MSEYIGSRISLISKSDIRYIGTLHEINSDNSTVALENVISHGTEGRRNNAAEEVAASDNVYEYIVFRGSDVKDLRIEETPKESKPPQPPMPNDPAILGAGRPPLQNMAAQLHHPELSNRPQQPTGFSQPPMYNPYAHYPLQGQRFVPQGGFHYPGMPYRGIPNWYQPNQGLPQPPGPYNQSSQIPPASRGQSHQDSLQGLNIAKQVSASTIENKEEKQKSNQTIVGKTGSSKHAENNMSGKLSNASERVEPSKVVLPPSIETKPNTSAIPPFSASNPIQESRLQPASAAGKSTKIVPAVPIPSPNPKNALASTTNSGPSTSRPKQDAAKATVQYQNATQAATAAVAAAMAKLPKPNNQAKSGEKPEKVSKKPGEMHVADLNKQSGTSGYAGSRGNGNGVHGGRRPNMRDQRHNMEVPTTDFDFESSNAKFNKMDLVYEAASSPVKATRETKGKQGTESLGTDSATATSGGEKGVKIPMVAPVPYNRLESFFDNISSELNDPDDAKGRKLGGQEFRSKERKKNMETFGQGSVDNYRGGFWGRGRGKDYLYSRGGRGGNGRGFKSVGLNL